MNYYIEELITQVRTHADEDDDKIVNQWSEIVSQITSLDISLVVAQQREEELKYLNEWLKAVDNCFECGKKLPRSELYALSHSLDIEKVEYQVRGRQIWRNASGGCYDCIKAHVDYHTRMCLDCGTPFFRRTSKETRCSTCQSKTPIVASHNRRARKLGLPASLNHFEWDETLIYFDHRCAYCSGEYEVIEHFTPLEGKGETSVKNCIPACSHCNSVKSRTDGRTEQEELAHRLSIPIERIQSIAQYLDSR